MDLRRHSESALAADCHASQPLPTAVGDSKTCHSPRADAGRGARVRRSRRCTRDLVAHFGALEIPAFAICRGGGGGWAPRKLNCGHLGARCVDNSERTIPRSFVAVECHRERIQRRARNPNLVVGTRARERQDDTHVTIRRDTMRVTTRHDDDGRYYDDTARRAGRDSTLARTSICDLAPFNSICALRPAHRRLSPGRPRNTLCAASLRAIANVVPRLSRAAPPRRNRPNFREYRRPAHVPFTRNPRDVDSWNHKINTSSFYRRSFRLSFLPIFLHPISLPLHKVDTRIASYAS